MIKTDNNLKIVLTGGGSGGHVIPLLALLPELRQTFQKIIFIGGQGIERELAKNEGLNYFEIITKGYSRGKLFKNLKTPFLLCSATHECIKLFKKERPDIIFGKGGYIEMPTVLAGKFLHIPIVCHESDLSLGLANKIAYKLGATILTGFDQTASLNSKFIYTGYPIRKKVFLGNKLNVIKKYNLDTTKKTILVMGGSLGAYHINDILSQSLPTLLKSYNVLHLTGKNKNNIQKQSGYYPVEFTNNIADFYDASDIIISRSGAGALSEISLLSKPAIFIPLPNTASRGDQLLNAQIAKQHNATIIYQEDLNKDTFINAIYKCHKPMTAVSKVGNQEISNILTAFAERHHNKK